MFNKIEQWYSSFFSVNEIAASKRLKIVFLASWFLCIYDLTMTVQGGILQGVAGLRCWVYNPDCNKYIKYLLPNSYAFNTLNALILGVLFLSVFFLIIKKWSLAHFFLALVIIWKTLFIYYFFNIHRSNFELFHLFPSFILLFSRNKIRSLKFMYALMYLFASRVKFDDAWILGSYFSSMTHGIPLFPDSFIPYVTNLVILGEIVLSIGLIYPNKKFQRISIWAWTLFHLYSAIIVGYYYPVRCMLFLWTIFGLPELNSDEQNTSDKYIYYKTIFIASTFSVMNFLPSFISKNPNEVLEGLDVAFHMINSNYQCQTTLKYYDGSDKEITEWWTVSAHPMNRCYILEIFQKAKLDCKYMPGVKRISMIFWQARNGSPFYELVNQANVCSLDYKFFSHNSWIQYSEDSLIKGYPVKNSLTPQRWQQEKLTIRNVPLPDEVPPFLRRNYGSILIIYKIIWALGFIYFIYLAIGDRFKNLFLNLIRR